MSSRAGYSGWFRYFPDDYRWSAAFALVLGSAPYGGAELGEVHRVGQQLLGHEGDDGRWFECWSDLGRRLERAGQASEEAGRLRTAASVYLRACSAYQIGERFRLPKDDRALEAFGAGTRCFGRFGELGGQAVIAPVEVPYTAGVGGERERPAGSSMPAYLVLPEGSRAPLPCVVCFDGLDVTKELVYMRGAIELTRRGLACLLVDGPGTGGSIRYRGLHLTADYERAGSAALDFLAGRAEIDLERVGVMALSLGGYYATRCAAREQRFAACVAWGAIWDYRAVWERRAKQSFRAAMSVAGDHIRWVLGCESWEEVWEALRPFSLEGVAQEVRCPYLLLHGTRDEQVPFEDAERLFEAVGSKDKTFEVFDEERGGATHCQNDQLTAATVVWADWLAQRLGGTT